ncbi:unnamed protein product [Cochlearia groenlandica]
MGMLFLTMLLKFDKVGADWAYKGMKEKGIEPDIATFNMMISSQKSKEILKAELKKKSMVRNGFAFAQPSQIRAELGAHGFLWRMVETSVTVYSIPSLFGKYTDVMESLNTGMFSVPSLFGKYKLTL